jgi:hypothetical protein
MSLLRKRALDRLANPPHRVRRELEPAPPLESVDRAQQSRVAFLHEIGPREAAALERAGDRHHQPQVRLDEPDARRLAAPDRALQVRVLGVGGGAQRGRGSPASLDGLRELHLTGPVQQPAPAGTVPESTQGLVPLHRAPTPSG